MAEAAAISDAAEDKDKGESICSNVALNTSCQATKLCWLLLVSHCTLQLKRFTHYYKLYGNLCSVIISCSDVLDFADQPSKLAIKYHLITFSRNVVFYHPLYTDSHNHVKPLRDRKVISLGSCYHILIPGFYLFSVYVCESSARNFARKQLLPM